MRLTAGWFLDAIALGLACAYALFWRFLLMAENESTGSVGVWDQVAVSCLDPRIVLYVFVPIILFNTLRDEDRARSDLALLRYGSHWKWLGSVSLAAVKESAKLVLFLVLAAWASAVGLGGLGNWSQATTSVAVVAAFGYPLPAVIGLSLVSQFIFLSTMATLVSTISMLLPRSFGPVLAGLIFCGLVITFHAPTDFPWLNFADGLSLEAAMRDFGTTPFTMLPPTLLLMGICFSAIAFVTVRRAGGLGRTMLSSWLFSYIAAFALLGMQLGSRSSSSATESLAIAFQGASDGGGALAFYGLSVLLFLGPVISFVARLDEVMGPILPQQLLRYGTVVKWWFTTLMRAMRDYLLFILVLSGYGLALSLLLTGSVGDPQELGLFTFAIFWQLLVNGILQGWFYLIVVVGVRWLSGSANATIGCIGIFAVGGFFLAAHGFPASQNSLGLLLSRDPVMTSLELVGWIVAAILVSVISIKKFVSQSLERNLV
ncbi:MAG: hypothetical protein LBI99_06350 [Propionibacteriaceae bacterium]|jgi:hypothetical protein|nr:hypothetical protein [Propionibacteriaceae bacterium]